MHFSTAPAYQCLYYSRLASYIDWFTITFAILDLLKIIEKSFTPLPEVVEIKDVRDIKEWLLPHTPPLHDHLKAHQFKFQLGRDGVSRMYYKEWSSDPFWLPDSGMCLLQESNSRRVPADLPSVIQPFYDCVVLDQIECTIAKLGGYLEKSGAAIWWNEWLANARLHINEVESISIAGMLMRISMMSFMGVFFFLFFLRMGF